MFRSFSCVFFNKPWRLKWKSRVGKNSRVLFISTTTTGFSLETKISSELIQPCIEIGPPKRSVSIRCGPFRQYVLWDSGRGLLCSTWLEFENIFFFFSVLIILLLHWAIAIGRVVGGEREPSSFIHVREAFRHHLSSFGPFVAQSSSRLYRGIILRKQTIAIRQQHILLEDIILFFLLPPPLIFILCFHHSEMMDLLLLLLLDASIGGVLQVSEK
jgi:hypothetical protein